MPEVITDSLDLWTTALLSKSTAGRGRNGKQEAYGIKKLRELILELAVRGKLVPQDPNDDPASVLLEKISEKKEQLVREGNIKEKLLPDITDVETQFDIPTGWQWVRLGDLADIIRGVTYKKHEAQESEFAGSIALMRANNIGGVLNFDRLVYVPKKLIRGEQVLVTGDLLIAMSSGSADLVGKAAQMKSDIAVTFGAFCGVVRPKSSELWDFLGFFFKTPLYRDQTAESGKGIGINNLNKGALENLLVVIPPQAEQHRIVAKVDELMALCNQLEQQQIHSLEAHQTLVETLLGALTRVASPQELNEAWPRIANHFDTLLTTEHSIDQLKQTILQLAVMGKLVPQDPNDEPASVLFEQIVVERARLVEEGKSSKEKPVPKLPGDRAALSLPPGWDLVRLGNLISLISGQHLKPEEYSNDASDEMIPYLTGPAEFGELFPAPTRFTAEKRAVAEPGDVLITCKGSGVGKTNVADRQIAISRQLMSIRPIIISTDFIKLLSDSLEEAIRENIVGIAIPGISRKDVLDVVVLLPPLDEQHRIVAKVDELMALCDALKARLADAQTTQIYLADAIVEQAVA